jgi:hypothetical protein
MIALSAPLDVTQEQAIIRWDGQTGESLTLRDKESQHANPFSR